LDLENILLRRAACHGHTDECRQSRLFA
jgi:hypothetical protein